MNEKQNTAETSDSARWKVGSVSKALSVLNCFTQSRQELTLTEISKMLNYPKSTLLNMIRTLEAERYLYRVKYSQSYRLSYKILELAYFMRTSMPINQYAIPLMEDLQLMSGENVYLTTHIDGRVLYLEALYSGRRSAKYSISGKTLPMHCTSCGKAMLSYLPRDEVNRIIHHWGLAQITPNTIADEDTLEEELLLTSQRGYALDVEEESLGVKCVAVAIRNNCGRAIGALSISGSVISMKDELLPQYAAELSKAASILSNYAELFLAEQFDGV